MTNRKAKRLLSEADDWVFVDTRDGACSEAAVLARVAVGVPGVVENARSAPPTRMLHGIS